VEEDDAVTLMTDVQSAGFKDAASSGVGRRLLRRKSARIHAPRERCGLWPRVRLAGAAAMNSSGDRDNRRRRHPGRRQASLHVASPH
jgi:hypothetical protein